MPSRKRAFDDSRRSRDELPLTDFLTYRLLILGHLVNRAGQRWHRENSGLLLVEWRVLAVLGYFGPSTAGSVAARMLLDKALVSRINSSLVERGLVRERAVDGDLRKRLLSLTTKGAKLYERIIPLARERQRALTRDLPPEDVEAFERVVAHLIDRFERRLQ